MKKSRVKTVSYTHLDVYKRQEVTGGLSDVTLRDMDERLQYLRNLEARKEEVIRLIDEQGKLTEELKGEIKKAEVCLLYTSRCV